MELHQLLLFVAAGLLLNLTPGPDVLYIVTNSLRSGAKAGVMAALGINAGCFVHIFAAALGVSALLAASATAFMVLKWLGAIYLLYIGGKLLLARSPDAAQDLAAIARSQPPMPLRSVFLGGFWTNVLNPKVAIFFLAFVPQFIPTGLDHKAIAFIALGALFNINSVFVNAGWAAAAAWMARREAVQRGMHWLDRVAGAMFIAFGLKLALTQNPNT
ncbi:MAG TPA: LysE family translocator [Ramlibacter sp.]|jgi:threonine/homoserine/homoserine lactone efflux protein|nr:LysE family translocator [Ramlibacter sp.]